MPRVRRPLTITSPPAEAQTPIRANGSGSGIRSQLSRREESDKVSSGGRHGIRSRHTSAQEVEAMASGSGPGDDRAGGRHMGEPPPLAGWVEAGPLAPRPTLFGPG